MKTNHKANFILSAVLLLALGIQPMAFGQGTAFTYQGQLTSGGSPANGSYDLTFSLFGVATSGNLLAGPLTNSATPVSNGLFTVTLDFGNQFPGAARWLEIATRTNGNGAFTILSPRQPFTSAPYAIQAGNAAAAVTAASANSVAAANISGALTAAQLPASVVLNGATNISLSGAFLGNGAGLTNVLVGSLLPSQVLAWGQDTYGQIDVPPAAQGTVVALAGNIAQSLALKSDGTVVGWGADTTSVGVYPNFGQAIVPAGLSNVVAVAAGQLHSLALKNDGTIVGWGYNLYHQATAPPTAQSGVAAVAAGGLFSMALTTNGTMVAWGFGVVTNPPVAAQSNVVAIAAGNADGIVLTTSGGVIAWGGDQYGQDTVPPAAQSGITAIAAGYGHFLALTTNGGVVAWGFDFSGQADVPSSAQSGVVAIAANGTISMALKTNGTLVVWGDNTYGETTVPAQAQQVTVFGAGASHCLAFASPPLNGNGSGLVNLNAGNLTGTVSLNQLPGAVVTNGATNVNITGMFSGNGSGLTALNASNVTGTLPDALLSTNVALRSGGNTFNSNQIFAAGSLTMDNAQAFLAKNTNGTPEVFLWPRYSDNVSYLNYGTAGFSIRNDEGATTMFMLDNGNVGIGTNNPQVALHVVGNILAAGTITGTFSGNGSGLTALNASNVTGTLALTQLPAGILTNGETNVTLSGTFSGDGSGLTNLSAAQLASGTVPFTVLPSNLVTNGAANVNITGTFSGDGSRLTALNASNVTGTLAVTQLPAGVVTNGASGVSFTGTFSGNGAGITNVNLVLPSEGAISWGHFLTSFPNSGGEPLSVVAADVNGDGKMDLVSANYAGVSVSIDTNNGSGGFVTATTVSLTSPPAGVAVADVNGDGKMDLITANTNVNTLSVLTNNGNGGFVLASTLTVGAGPTAVVAVDVNGDGKVDLISANAGGSGTVTVLTNNGSGGFVQASSSYTLLSPPRAMIAVDVNGDGRLDLITANYTDNVLSLLINGGNGNFVAAGTFTVGSGPIAVAAADVNGDGKVDLISANFAAGSLSVLTNNGNGNFVVASSPLLGFSPSSVAAADVNGDGKVDLICANLSGNSVSVLTNNGSGGFALASTTTVGPGPRALVAADLNGDGKVDLACANSGDSSLTVLINTPMFQGYFSGNGAGLTNLNASQLTGTLPSAALAGTYSGALILNNTGNSFTGNGSGLTSLNASQLTSGTVPDAALSADVALRNVSNTFNGNQSITNGALYLDNLTSTADVLAKNASGAYEPFLWPRYSDNITYLNYGSAGFNIRNNSSSSTMFMQDNGNVGIANTAPNRLLTVGNGTNATDALISLGCGGGGAGRTWEIGVPYGTNLTGADFYSFVFRDTGVGLDRMMIQWGSGNVGIGTTNPDNLLTVNGSADKPGGGSWGTFSDARLKDVGSTFNHGLEALDGIQPIHYHYKSDNPLNLPSRPEYVGVVAQQVQKAVPEAVERNKDGYLVVNNDPIIWTMLNAIKELNQKVDEKDAENAELKVRLDKVEQLLNGRLKGGE